MARDLRRTVKSHHWELFVTSTSYYEFVTNHEPRSGLRKRHQLLTLVVTVDSPAFRFVRVYASSSRSSLSSCSWLMISQSGHVLLDRVTVSVWTKSVLVALTGLQPSGDLDDGFYVQDDGHGLPEGAHVELFEMGYSSSATGTGFGLGIVSEIADAHGWTVHASEGPGGGARFEISGVDTV